jgi:hypothetical protein
MHFGEAHTIWTAYEEDDESVAGLESGLFSFQERARNTAFPCVGLVRFSSGGARRDGCPDFCFGHLWIASLMAARHAVGENWARGDGLFGKKDALRISSCHCHSLLVKLIAPRTFRNARFRVGRAVPASIRFICLCASLET